MKELSKLEWVAALLRDGCRRAAKLAGRAATIRRLRAELVAVTAECDAANQRLSDAWHPSEPCGFPDGENSDEVLGYVAECARRWAADARLVGNARAADIHRACVEIIAERDRLVTLLVEWHDAQRMTGRTEDEWLADSQRRHATSLAMYVEARRLWEAQRHD